MQHGHLPLFERSICDLMFLAKQLNNGALPMLHTTFYQRSFLELDPDVIGLPANSFESQLGELLPRIVSPEDFAGFYHESIRTSSCCPMLLTGMLMLQHRYNLTDPELVIAPRPG